MQRNSPCMRKRIRTRQPSLALASHRNTTFALSLRHKSTIAGRGTLWRSIVLLRACNRWRRRRWCVALWIHLSSVAVCVLILIIAACRTLLLHRRLGIAVLRGLLLIVALSRGVVTAIGLLHWLRLSVPRRQRSVAHWLWCDSMAHCTNAVWALARRRRRIQHVAKKMTRRIGTTMPMTTPA